MFNSQEYLQSSIENRKTIIGTAIFKHVEEIVGVQNAPKVTGMIIDLEPIELNFSVQNWEALQSKVNSAMRLLIEKGIVKITPADSHLSSAQMAFAPPTH